MTAKQNNANKKKNLIKLLVLVIAMVVLIGGGTLVYNLVLKNTKSPTNKTQQSQAVEAPDFTVYDRGGNKVNLSDYKGKPIVLNFWASWCTPCKYEMPYFQEVYNKYSDKLEVMMVNLNGSGNDTKANADSFILKEGFTFPVYYDTDTDAAIKYSISAMPTTFFVNENGEIILGYRGAITKDALYDGVDKLLNKD